MAAMAASAHGADEERKGEGTIETAVRDLKSQNVK